MLANQDTRRRFLRHIAEVPIEVCYSNSTEIETKNTHDISFGGLSFQSKKPLPLTQELTLAIRITQPYFVEEAQVTWCKKINSCYEIGVKFIATDAIFRIRMIEQVCHIEKYRQDMLETHGRALTAQDAAMEWINKYGADFRPI